MSETAEMPRARAREEVVPHRFAKDQLKALVERIERLQEEKKAIGGDIADVYREAKANGYDAKWCASAAGIKTRCCK